VAIVVLAACSSTDEAEPVTKADLIHWLEAENTDGSQGDPICTAEKMLATAPTQDDLRQFVAVKRDTAMAEYTEPVLMPIYVASRDACSAEALAADCAAGRLEPIECPAEPN